jgi:hypothetical protein
VVDQLDLASFYRQHRDDGHGHPAYNPKLLLGVLLYGYCKVLDLLGAAGRLDWSGANVDSMSVRAKRRSYRRQVALV